MSKFRNNQEFWLPWAGSSLFGAASGLLFSSLVILVTFGFGLLLVGAIVGYCIGGMQTLILKQLPNSELCRLLERSWIKATAIGWALGFISFGILYGLSIAVITSLGREGYLPVLVPIGVLLLCSSIILGVLVLSLAQWSILRRSIPLIYLLPKWQWALLAVVGWTTGVTVVAISLIPLFTDLPSPDGTIPTGFFILSYIALTIVFSISASSTGIGLMRMIRKLEERSQLKEPT